MRTVHFSFFIALFFSAYTAVGQSLNDLGEVRVSDDDFTEQRMIDVAVHEPTGNVIFVWNNPDAGLVQQGEVLCAIYDQDLSLLVNPFRVNNNDDDRQYQMKVVAHPEDNSFAVVWTSGHNYATTREDVYAKKILLGETSTYYNGIKNQSDLLVNEQTTLKDQRVKAIAIDEKADALIVGYNEYVTGNTDINCYLRRIDWSTFSTVGTSFAAVTHSSVQDIVEDIAFSPVTGELLVTYRNNSTGDSDCFLSVWKYDPVSDAYSNSTSFKTNTTTSNEQMVSEVIVNGRTGDYFVSWTSTGSQDGSGRGIYGKIYDKGHQVIESEFLVNGNTTGHQQYGMSYWEEENNYLITAYYYYVSGITYLKYRVFDDQYNGLPEEHLLFGYQGGVVNLTSGFTQAFNLTGNKGKHRIYAAYDLFDNFSTTSKSYCRMFSFPFITLNTVHASSSPFSASAPGLGSNSFTSGASGTGNGMISVFPDAPASGVNTLTVNVSADPGKNEAATIKMDYDPDMDISNVRILNAASIDVPLAREFYAVHGNQISFYNERHAVSDSLIAPVLQLDEGLVLEIDYVTPANSDLFQINGFTRDDFDDVILRVKDLQGNQVKQINDFENTWDGVISGSTYISPGVYHFELEFQSSETGGTGILEGQFIVRAK